MAFNPSFWNSGRNLRGFPYSNKKKSSECEKETSISPVIFKRMKNIEDNLEKLKKTIKAEFLLFQEEINSIKNSILDLLTESEANELYQFKSGRNQLNLSDYGSSTPLDISTIPIGFYDIVESGYICSAPNNPIPNARKRQLPKGSFLYTDGLYSFFVDDEGETYLVDNAGSVYSSWGKGIHIDRKTLESYCSAFLVSSDAAETYLSKTDAQSNYQKKLTAGQNITIDNNVISASGGGEEWVTINEITLEEDTSSISVITDENDNPFSVKKIRVTIKGVSTVARVDVTPYYQNSRATLDAYFYNLMVANTETSAFFEIGEHFNGLRIAKGGNLPAVGFTVVNGNYIYSRLVESYSQEFDKLVMVSNGGMFKEGTTFIIEKSGINY